MGVRAVGTLNKQLATDEVLLIVGLLGCDDAVSYLLDILAIIEERSHYII